MPRWSLLILDPVCCTIYNSMSVIDDQQSFPPNALCSVALSQDHLFAILLCSAYTRLKSGYKGEHLLREHLLPPTKEY